MKQLSIDRKSRRPWAELSIFIAGLLGVLVSIPFESEPIFIGAILACLISVLSAVFSAILSRLSSLVVHVLCILLGVAGVVYGTSWYLENMGATNILYSPIFLAYLGGGLSLAGVLNLIYRLRSK